VPKAIEQFNPSRLTLARRRRGLSKTALAEQIGVDRRAINAYEKAEYEPAEDTLSKLERALGFPMRFFFGDDLDEPTAASASFRAMSRMTAAQRDMALGEGALALHLNRWLESRFQLPEATFPDLDRQLTPAAAAASLRAAWARGELPIKNMIHLLESKGVRVFSLDIDAREVDAFSMWQDSTPFVFLNLQKSAEHSRFDAAHELGHLVLHRHGGPQGREAEQEADAFASEFLMPRSSVLARAPHFAILPALIQLKKIWIVSVAALTHRLHSLGVLSEWHYRSLCIEMAGKGYRTHEPDPAPPETSLVLPKIFTALRTDGVTRLDVASELCLTEEELSKLLFRLVMTGLRGGKSAAEMPERRTAPQLTLLE